MKKFNLAIVFLIVFTIVSPTLFAQKNMNKKMKIKKRFQELNLTESQMKEFRSNKFSFEETKIEVEAELKKNKIQIKKMVANNTIDENKMMALIDKSSQLKAKLMKSRIKMWLDNRKILNDEQKKIWSSTFNIYGDQVSGFNNMGNKCFKEHRRFSSEGRFERRHK